MWSAHAGDKRRMFRVSYSRPEHSAISRWFANYQRLTVSYKTVSRQCRSTTHSLYKMIPNPISSPSSATGQISLLGSLQTLGRLGLLLVLGVTRLLELIRTFLRPRSGGETVRAISSSSAGSGDGTSCSTLFGLRRKHRSSILWIHFLNFAVGDVPAVAADKSVNELRRNGDSERGRFFLPMSAARWLLTNTSRSSAGEMKYANGS